MTEINARKGFTLVEILIAVALLAVVLLVFFALFKSGIMASDRGQVAAQTRENARMAIDRIESEMRQAVAVPAGCGNAQLSPPAVIYPGPGTSLGFRGGFAESESAAVGCSMGTGSCISANNTSPLNNAVSLPAVTGASVKQQADAGPSGFVIFSEVLKQAGGGSGIYVPGDPAYLASLQNYVWVMYEIDRPQNAPPQLARYTFNVGSQFQGLTGDCGNWGRDDKYFVPANSREQAAGTGPSVVVSLGNPNDQIWLMVSHQALPSGSELQTQTGDLLDPVLFGITDVVNQYSMQNAQSSGLGMLTATLSSQVKVEGALSSNAY